MKHVKHYQFVYLLAAMLAVACGNNQPTRTQPAATANWPDAEKAQFLRYCSGHFEEHNSTKAKEICDCILNDAMEKYPEHAHADTLEQQDWEALVVNSNCVDHTLLEERTSWGKAEEDGFMKECVAAALKKGDSQEQAGSFCSCALEKVKITLPNPHLTDGLTDEEYNRVIAACEAALQK